VTTAVRGGNKNGCRGKGKKGKSTEVCSWGVFKKQQIPKPEQIRRVSRKGKKRHERNAHLRPKQSSEKEGKKRKKGSKAIKKKDSKYNRARRTRANTKTCQ